MEIRFVYMTAGSPEEAAAIGRSLVEERLAACVNIITPMQSIYRWEGRIEEAAEAVMVAKTTARCLDRLVSRVKALHSYDCPCIVAWEITAGNPAFLDWIAEETTGTRETTKQTK
jgi:periplasmic divalent cation tolerance protein